MRVGTFQAAAPGGGAGAAADEHAASDVPPALPPPESSSRERMSAVRTLRGAGGLSLDVPHVSSDEEGEVEGVEAIEEGAELPWNEEEDDYYASDYSEYEEEITWAFYLRWHTAHLLDSPRVQARGARERSGGCARLVRDAHPCLRARLCSPGVPPAQTAARPAARAPFPRPICARTGLPLRRDALLDVRARRAADRVRQVVRPGLHRPPPARLYALRDRPRARHVGA
jgi:hypothetical protein